MKSRNIATRGTVMLGLVGCLIAPGLLQAQTMDQYYAVPPFVSDQVAPNIILLLDNSGSMSGLACDLSNPADGDCSDATTSTFRHDQFLRLLRPSPLLHLRRRCRCPLRACDSEGNLGDGLFRH